jgi:hypothetical protein
MTFRVKKIFFAHHLKKAKHLLFERSEFRCFAFYNWQKIFLAKCHSTAWTTASRPASH